ncbi:MAG: hypothetical protein A2Z83_01370 [Omnitrophica bacterium GWA2_52_8]|nr:MAG: hypothetical protein A2Z83_01370 [Omnitrophica bacterium GWA2_52_8]
MARKTRGRFRRKWGFRKVFESAKKGVIFCLKAVPIAVVLGLGFGAFFTVKAALLQDAQLLVRQISVSPAEQLRDEKIKSLEGRYLNHNILTVDIEEIADQLEKDPEIQRAVVTRELPSTLKIELKKRIPIAYIRFSVKGEYGLISEDGMILDVSPKMSGGAVLIEAYQTKIVRPQIGMRFKNEGFQAAMAFLRKFIEQRVSHEYAITMISCDQAGNVTVMLGDGPPVRMGRDPASRIDRLEKIIPLLESSGQSKIEYIDLQFDDVIVKKR